MATLDLKTLSTMVQDIAAAVQARATALIDFSKGSVLLAVAEAAAAVYAWLQANVLKVLKASRLSTSEDGDVDTWLDDFDVARIVSSAAAGNVTFSRFSPANASIVPVGAEVQSSDGTWTFAVIADTGNAAYSAALGTSGGYLIAAGTSSVTVPVEATVGGTGGNVTAGTITTLLTPISGVDSVTNAAAFSGGAGKETDDAVKARFRLHWLGLSKANEAGVEAAIAATNLSVRYTVTENEAYDGTYSPGSFFVVVDDGTGNPAAALVSAVTTAVWSARGLSIQPSVHAAVQNPITISMTLAIASGYARTTVIAALTTQLESKVAALGLGAGLPFYDVATWAKSVAGVADITDVMLDGLTGDAASITGDPRKTITLETLVVN